MIFPPFSRPGMLLFIFPSFSRFPDRVGALLNIRHRSVVKYSINMYFLLFLYALFVRQYTDQYLPLRTSTSKRHQSVLASTSEFPFRTLYPPVHSSQKLLPPPHIKRHLEQVTLPHHAQSWWLSGYINVE